MRRDPFAADLRAAPVSALDYFTNRENFLAAFARHVGTPTDEDLSALVFYGVGGIGKTTLVRKLCADLAGSEFAVPHARFNLENISDQAQAYRDVLLHLRSDLETNFGVTFPRFDLALTVLLASEGGKPPPLVQISPGLDQAFSFAVELTPNLVKAGLRVAGQQLRRAAESSPGLERWVRRVGGTEAVLALSERLTQDDRTVPEELIRRFTQDLAAGLPERPGRACRGVVFLDTYEALWTGRENSRAAQARLLDAWVRLLAEFLLGAGVLPVIAGRDRLDWGDGDPEWAACLDQHLLGGVSASDAQGFLARRGIGVAPPQAPLPLQEAILRCTDAAAPGQTAGCHLLALALSADIVLNTRLGGDDPDPDLFRGVPPARMTDELAARFLKSLHNRNLELWVEALSLTPRFDEATALALDDARRLHVGRAGWEQLRHYSFILSQPDGFFRMHRTMREVLRARTSPDDAARLHAWFEEHWDARGESGAAFYHRWSLDPEGQLGAWADGHAAALSEGRAGDAGALLARWAEVALDDDDRSRVNDSLWARTHAVLGEAQRVTPIRPRYTRLLGAIQHLRAALTVWTEATTPDDWAQTRFRLGLALSALPTGDRAENLRHAEDSYRAALRVWTETAHSTQWADVQSNLGIACALRPTGNRANNLQEGTACFEAALRVRTRTDWPFEWSKLHNNLGCNALLMPGADRTETLRRAAACFSACLELQTEDASPQMWASTQHNLGIVFFDLPGGDRAANLRQSAAHYEAALRVYLEESEPDTWAEIQNGLGNTLSAVTGPDQAESLRRAITCFQSAQRVWTETDNPERWAQAQNNQGRALLTLAEGDPRHDLGAAIACFHAALRFHTEESFPDHWASAQKNLGRALAASGTGDAAVLAQARGHLEAAARGFRAVGCVTDAEEADRLAADLGSA